MALALAQAGWTTLELVSRCVGAGGVITPCRDPPDLAVSEQQPEVQHSRGRTVLLLTGRSHCNDLHKLFLAPQPRGHPSVCALLSCRRGWMVLSIPAKPSAGSVLGLCWYRGLAAAGATPAGAVHQDGGAGAAGGRRRRQRCPSTRGEQEALHKELFPSLCFSELGLDPLGT